jgi:hypothetical protein
VRGYWKWFSFGILRGGDSGGLTQRAQRAQRNTGNMRTDGFPIGSGRVPAFITKEKNKARWRPPDRIGTGSGLRYEGESKVGRGLASGFCVGEIQEV